MSLEADLLGVFETHSPEEIRRLLQAGVSPVEPIQGQRPIDCLLEMYLRSPRFADCVRVMLEADASIDDPVLKAVVLDEEESLRQHITASPLDLTRRLSLRTTFTPCEGVTALHLCAEFNSIRCAHVSSRPGPISTQELLSTRMDLADKLQSFTPSTAT